jgi:predicted dehydrogenase
MRGAIVGFGTIAMGHMAGYGHVDDLSVVAAVDVSPARRRYAETTFGIPTYATIADLAAHERLDFVDICTPPSTHGEYGVFGLVHGWHVLCEKPVFLPSGTGYETLMNTIWDSDRVFYPCHVYKFAPILDAVKELTRAPGFGSVLGADFRTLRCGHAVGVPEWRPHWRREREISLGGILRDHGPHSIYLAMDLTGRTPESVSCLMGGLREEDHSGTEDTVLLRMRCEDRVEITLTLSWAADYRSTTYSIAGESGFVLVDGDDLLCTSNGNVLRSVIESGFDDPSHKDWFVHMLLDFAKATADPGRQTALIREALVTAFVIEAAYESAARSGHWVDVIVPAHLLALGGNDRPTAPTARRP